MTGMRYLSASALLGLIAVWASENLFWIAPPAGLTLFDLAYLWVVYSFCTGSALSAVFVTGIRGLPAVFLGAAIMGWLVEGVVVAEMYLAFPVQLVWTPLAWHALISGVGVFAVGRAVVHWRLGRQIMAYLLLGLFLAFWAQFWPTERPELPEMPFLRAYLNLLAYLGALGLGVPVAHLLLDRITPLERPKRWVLMIAPLTLAVVWVVQSLQAPSIRRLSLPVLLALTFWVMKRLGGAGAGGSPVDFGRPAPQPMRHFIFLLVPVLGAGLAVTGWAISGGFEANVALGLVLIPVSLLAYGWLGLRAERLQRK